MVKEKGLVRDLSTNVIVGAALGGGLGYLLGIADNLDPTMLELVESTSIGAGSGAVLGTSAYGLKMGVVYGIDKALATLYPNSYERLNKEDDNKY